MKVFILCISFLAFGQYCSATNVIAALRNAILDGYEKGAKPDGQVTVKAGATITDFSLCAHREVSKNYQSLLFLIYKITHITLEFVRSNKLYITPYFFNLGFDNHWLVNNDVDW